ncbi:MAG: TIGR00730 family Rossman fold protein [Ignavibacteriales bacterium]|nr:MAG: TIGR00730 family Rossman fold protein [Ignavibacteriales bacterium]
MTKSVCVFCASSSRIDIQFLNTAYRCGEVIASAGLKLIYGGGAKGSMGYVANGAISKGGHVTGIIPQFMIDLEWAHKGLKELIIVETMAERKSRMLQLSDAVLVLPGGSGTLEELFETISLKRLGMYLKPIIILNEKKFYDPLKSLLEGTVKEKFMDKKHLDMWDFISGPDEIIDAINRAVKWDEDAIKFAAV